MKKRGKYKPKEENVRKLYAFLKQIEKDELRKDIRDNALGSNKQ